ncbi:transposase [Streptosporangium canum]|uniref:transposase n=1 Tax=Streptosporangium canum TaxID=324952 RepID=UPI003F4DC5E3
MPFSFQDLPGLFAGAGALEDAATAAFRAHPDHEVISSFPGSADLTGARLLGEMGDDRTRFADARALKAYAGAAPITRAGGRSHTVVRRRVKTQRLAAVGYVWAFAFRRALNYPERTKADLLIRRFWVRDPGSPSDVADRAP